MKKSKPKTTKESASRKQITRFCLMLNVEIQSLEWTPIGQAAEMCGPDGGWVLVTKDGHDVMGLNADDLCQSLLTDVRFHDQSQLIEKCMKIGRAEGARHKDAIIATLKQELLCRRFGSASQTVVNEQIANAVRTLIKSVWATSYGHPPLRQMWIMRDIVQSVFGEDWNEEKLCRVPDKPVQFHPITGDAVKKYYDGGPWVDLEAIRQAAGTQDTAEIVAMVVAGKPSTL